MKLNTVAHLLSGLMLGHHCVLEVVNEHAVFSLLLVGFQPLLINECLKACHSVVFLQYIPIGSLTDFPLHF